MEGAPVGIGIASATLSLVFSISTGIVIKFLKITQNKKPIKLLCYLRVN